MRAAPALAPLLILVACAGCAREVQDDLLLRGGSVVDGTGRPPFQADVAVRDGRIVAVGDLTARRAGREVDVSGRWVCPGLVDMHSHADLILLGGPAVQERLLRAKVLQGVTTVVVGNCGLGAAPATEEASRLLAAVNGWMTPEGVAPGPMTAGEYLARLEALGLVVNAGTLLPHGPLRISVMGIASGAPDPGQLTAMREALARGLDEGALGLSAGLIYPPGMYAQTDELADLAKVVAARDRLFTCHVRGSSETLLRATEELVSIARRSRVRAHHSHLEAVGERFWPEVARVLDLEDEARGKGLRLSHDVFPYTRAATMMSALFPPWALEGGVSAFLGRLRDPGTRARIGKDLEERVPEWPPWKPGGWPHNLVEAVGWDGILVASVGPGGPPDLVGRSLEAIAAERAQTPFDVAADLMLSQEGQVGQLVCEVSGRDEDTGTLLSILAHPAAAVVSDAEDYGRGLPHPAQAGAFARALRLCRERGLMPLEEAVRRMTSYPARLLGLGLRGEVREGSWADLLVLDPARVADRATWESPREPAAGISWVFVNGRPVVEEGRFFGGAFGRVLRAERAQAE